MTMSGKEAMQHQAPKMGRKPRKIESDSDSDGKSDSNPDETFTSKHSSLSYSKYKCLIVVPVEDSIDEGVCPFVRHVPLVKPG